MNLQQWCMALLNQLVKNMKDKKGSAVLIFGLLFLIPLFMFSFWIIESKLLNTQYNMADDAVVSAGLGALRSTNTVDLAYGEYNLDPDTARETFYDLLRKNMKLDYYFRPMPGSIAVGPVFVSEFRVYNPGDYPTECPRGTPINNTSIHVVVKFKVKRPVLRGMFGQTVDMTIHRDVDNYYSLELED